jgi:predicted DNA-binding transcriptional regulator YafY
VERRRLVADRFTRIWSLVETIAHEPGLSRGELAQRFALSERQLQADLNVIKQEIGLPLVRLHGYRFDSDGATDGDLGLRDALTLYLLVQRAAADESFPRDALAEIERKLPRAFPPMLQPLASRTLSSAGHDGYGPGPEIFACLAEALVRQQPVKLRYGAHSAVGYLTEPIVEPRILLPYQNAWYLIGRCHQRQRDLMFPLEGLESASLEL